MLGVLRRQLLFPVSIKPLWLLFLDVGALIRGNIWDVLPQEQEGFSVLPKEHPGHPEDCISTAQGEPVGYGSEADSEDHLNIQPSPSLQQPL